MVRALLLGLWIGIIGCGDSSPNGSGSGGSAGSGGSGGTSSNPGGLEWEISYAGGLSGTVGGPICTVTGQNDIITIGCINRESPEAFNASASLPLYQVGMDTAESATMKLADGTDCAASSSSPPVLTVTTATDDLYILEIAGNMECNGQEVTLDGTIETDGVVDLT